MRKEPGIHDFPDLAAGIRLIHPIHQLRRRAVVDPAIYGSDSKSESRWRSRSRAPNSAAIWRNVISAQLAREARTQFELGNGDAGDL